MIGIIKAGLHKDIILVKLSIIFWGKNTIIYLVNPGSQKKKPETLTEHNEIAIGLSVHKFLGEIPFALFVHCQTDFDNFLLPF